MLPVSIVGTFVSLVLTTSLLCTEMATVAQAWAVHLSDGTYKFAFWIYGHPDDIGADSKCCSLPEITSGNYQVL